MTISFSFANSGHWDLLGSFSYQAESVPEVLERFKPIPLQKFPILIEERAIAIFSQTPDGSGNTRNYGQVFQIIATGLQAPGQPDAYAAARRFYLGQITLMIFDPIASAYSVAMQFPFWWRAVDISVWRYIGPEADLTAEGVEAIRSSVNEINAKVDQLLAEGGNGQGNGGLYIPPGLL